ncbi:hypothetical protein, partial [Microcoleus sp. Pol14C4]
MITNDDEFQAEKAKLQAETAAANKRYEDTQVQRQKVLLDSHLEAAYRDAGGISGDAFEALKNSLNCRIDGDRIVILDSSGNIETNADGSPKNLSQKMTEAKQHPVYQSFFKPDSTTPQNANSKPQLAPG